MALLAFIYAIYIIGQMSMALMVPETEYIKYLETQKMPQANAPTHQQLIAIMKTFIVLVLIHGLTIAANCVISSYFLNVWKKEHAAATEDNEHFSENQD